MLNLFKIFHVMFCGSIDHSTQDCLTLLILKESLQEQVNAANNFKNVES